MPIRISKGNGALMRIKVVEGVNCPGCDSLGPNEANRPKVGDEDGTWWWKCYTADCAVGYYNPDKGQYEERTDNHLLTAQQIREREGNDGESEGGCGDPTCCPDSYNGKEQQT